MSAAGRTVVFRALTTAWCMAALLVSPGLIRSPAVASLVVAFRAVGTLFPLPGPVAALGGRLGDSNASRLLAHTRRRCGESGRNATRTGDGVNRSSERAPGAPTHRWTLPVVLFRPSDNHREEPHG